MKFKLTKASDWNFETEIEINTLDDLLKLLETEGKLVLGNFDDDCKYSIIIYDDYLE